MEKCTDCWLVVKCEVKSQLLRKMEKLRTDAKEAFVNSKFESAAGLYGKAIILDPNDPILLSNRAQCFINLKKWNQALEDCSTGLLLSPNQNIREKLLYRMLIAAKNLGQISDSIACLEELLKFNPNNTAARRELELVNLLRDREHLQSLKKPKISPKEEQIPLAVVKQLPEHFANIVNPKITERVLPIPQKPFDADAVARASEDLFLDRPKKAAPQQDHTTFAQRPAMLKLSIINNLLPEIKAKAFGPILDLTETEIRELASVEPEFLQIFIESLTYGLTKNIASPPQLLRKLEVLLSLSRYSMALLMCDQTVVNQLIQQSQNSLPDLAASFAKLLT